MNMGGSMVMLIEHRMYELNLTRTDVVRRAGYANIAKGLRRLEALMNGDFDSTKALITRLPEAHELPSEAITQTIEQTRRQMEERKERAYRTSFKPHAVIITERRVPDQITFALLTEAPRHLHI